MEARRKTGPKRAPASSRRKPRQGPPGQPDEQYAAEEPELAHGEGTIRPQASRLRDGGAICASLSDRNARIRGSAPHARNGLPANGQAGRCPRGLLERAWPQALPCRGPPQRRIGLPAPGEAEGRDQRPGAGPGRRSLQCRGLLHPRQCAPADGKPQNGGDGLYEGHRIRPRARPGLQQPRGRVPSDGGFRKSRPHLLEGSPGRSQLPFLPL